MALDEASPEAHRSPPRDVPNDLPGRPERPGLIVDASALDGLPDGWRPLVGRLLSALVGVAKANPGGAVAVRSVRRLVGALDVEFEAIATAPGVKSDVRRLVDGAARASLETCSVCGSRGRMRLIAHDYAPLCDVHAAEAPAGAARTVRASEARADAGKGSAVTLARSVRRRPPGEVARQPPADFALYDLGDVAAAIGEGRHDRDGRSEADAPSTEAGAEQAPPPDGEQHARLRRILDAGDAARWRELARPAPTCLDEIDALTARAPHMSELTTLVRRHLMAATTVGLPTSLPPVMLSGPPGIGKTWCLGRLARLMGVPFRTFAMTGQSSADGLHGAHGIWRNAKPGLVARTLLSERFANPLLLVDEVDKAGTHAHEDPYRPFYALLEPEGARTFRDEYLEFAVDASRIMWVLAGNDPEVLPSPIRDRLTVIAIARPGEGQLRAIAASVYRELNAGMLFYFDPELPEATLERLLDRSPRELRKALAEAMTRAASEARRELRPGDVPPVPAPPSRIGFRLGGEGA